MVSSLPRKSTAPSTSHSLSDCSGKKTRFCISTRLYQSPNPMGQTMSASAAYDELLVLGARASSADAVAEMRQTFELRTGAFGPEDAWFEARGQAFWDDALTTQRFATRVESELGEETRFWAPRFERAQRGLFRAIHDAQGAGGFLLEDLWGGAEF